MAVYIFRLSAREVLGCSCKLCAAQQMCTHKKRWCVWCAAHGSSIVKHCASPAVQGARFLVLAVKEEARVSSGVLFSVVGGYVSNLSSVSRRHSKQADLVGPLSSRASEATLQRYLMVHTGLASLTMHIICLLSLDASLSTEWPPATKQMARTSPRLAPTLIFFFFQLCQENGGNLHCMKCFDAGLRLHAQLSGNVNDLVAVTLGKGCGDTVLVCP